MNVFILATVRKPELIDAACLVFKTLRTGFPTAHVELHTNGTLYGDRVTKDAKEAGCLVGNWQPTIHHDWISWLVANEQKPFFICDTDVVFWKSFEDFKFDGPIAGEFTPRFFDKFSRCVIQPRLHTALLYIDPVKVREAILKWENSVAKTPFTPTANLINPLVIPLPCEIASESVPMFFDTCSFLYHAIGGQRFNPEQLETFAHLNCGTWVDMIEASYPGMRGFHEAVYKDTRAALGLRRMQKEFYDRCAA